MERVKPTNGNMNLWISSNEINRISELFNEDMELVQSYLILIGELDYELAAFGDHVDSVVEFTEESLNRLKEGIEKDILDTETLYPDKPIKREDKFRVELKKGKVYWELDN